MSGLSRFEGEIVMAATQPAEIKHYIAGQQVNGKGRTLPVFNPATGEETHRVHLGGAEDVKAAVAAARKAFPAWAETTPLRRSRILNKFLRLVEENNDKLAKAITTQHGKTFSDAKGEV